MIARYAIQHIKTRKFMGSKKGQWTENDRKAHTFKDKESARLVASVMSYVLFDDCRVIKVK